MIFQEKCFSCYILLTDQISLSDCLYFSRYLAICVLKLFVNQAVTSWNLKLAFFLSSRIATWPKGQDKNLNILRTKWAFEMKQKPFFIIIKKLSFAKKCLRLESASLKATQKSLFPYITNLVFDKFIIFSTKKKRIYDPSQKAN